MFKIGNPVLNDKTFSQPTPIEAGVRGETMTVQGTIHRTALLLLLAFLPASYVWSQYFAGNTLVMPFVFVGLIGGLIVGLIISFKPTTAPLLSPIYALMEGLLLGGISAVLEAQFPGIVIQAVGLTFGVTAAVLMAYRSGLISAQGQFMRMVMVAMGGIFLMYMVSMVMRIFGYTMPLLHDSSPIGIGISVAICGVAAFMLIFDFDRIEQGERQGAPKFMEWYCAFGLMVGLVWLYLEMLRLLSKLKSRR